MCLKQGIKKTLGLLNRAITQIPSNRRTTFVNRVNTVLEKYDTNTNSQTELQSFLKQLQFNINFIKLSYPNLNIAQISKEQTHVDNGQLFQLDKGGLKSKQQLKLMSTPIRQEVDFSNWSQGNVDPENLRKHKQLIERQYYGGDFWKGKEKPKMHTRQFLQEALSSIDQSTMKDHVVKVDENKKRPQVHFDEDPKTRWEKVKR